MAFQHVKPVGYYNLVCPAVAHLDILLEARW